MHGAVTKAQHRRPVRSHREEQITQKRAVDAVDMAVARGSAASALHPYVARHDQVLVVVHVKLSEGALGVVVVQIVLTRAAESMLDLGGGGGGGEPGGTPCQYRADRGRIAHRSLQVGQRRRGRCRGVVKSGAGRSEPTQKQKMPLVSLHSQRPPGT